MLLVQAIWSRFFPVYKELGRRIKAGEIGEVVQVIVSFGRNLLHFNRLL